MTLAVERAHLARGQSQFGALERLNLRRTRVVVTKAQIAAEIRRIIDNQLDDCRRAIKAGTKTIAVNELEDAARKLKKLADFIEASPGSRASG